MHEKILEKIGLTSGESKVYLALLEIGETTTGSIIRKAMISSGKVYEILDKLIGKGLVSYMTKERTKYFTAAPPEEILTYIKEKEEKLKEEKNQIGNILPELEGLQEKNKKQYITKTYLGFKGIQSAMFEALEDTTPDEPILAMGIISEKPEQFNLLWPKFHVERLKRKIRCKLIFTEKDTEYYTYYKKMKLTEVKTLAGITPSVINIIGNNVLIFTYNENPACIVIKHPEILQSIKTFFESLWNISKP